MAAAKDRTNRGNDTTDDQQQPSQTQWVNAPPVIGLNRKVIIVDAAQIYDCLDLGRRIDVTWPNEQFRSYGGRSSWKDWQPQEGMVGNIVHYWQPNHPDHHFRSNVNRTIMLMKIGDRYVPIGEKGLKEYNTIGLLATAGSGSGSGSSSSASVIAGSVSKQPSTEAPVTAGSTTVSDSFATAISPQATLDLAEHTECICDDPSATTIQPDPPNASSSDPTLV